MTELENEKHEMFAHFIARGNIPVTAYVGAGYPRNEAAALAMLKLPAIAARIEELKPLYHELYRGRTNLREIAEKRRKMKNARS